MIHILLMILKIIGIILLVILGILLLIILAVLFAPVRYKAELVFTPAFFPCALYEGRPEIRGQGPGLQPVGQA